MKMLAVFLVLLVLLVSGCCCCCPSGGENEWEGTSGGGRECSSDYDCDSGEECTYGYCV